jgi:hypothetical protein
VYRGGARRREDSIQTSEKYNKQRTTQVVGWRNSVQELSERAVGVDPIKIAIT